MCMKNYNLTFALGLTDLGRPLFKRGASADTELSIDAQREMNRENNEFNAQQAQLTRDFDADQAQLNRDFQGQMQSQQMQWNEDMWNKQNEYNTPANQLARASASGINPNAIFGGLSSQAQAVGGVSGVSGAQASGPAASAASVPTVMGTSKFTQVLNALNSVLHDGSTVAEMLYGTDVKKANARLTNANAEAQEIQNNREKSKDEAVRTGFSITEDGRIVPTSSVGPNDKVEPLVMSSKFNSGTLEGYNQISQWVKNNEVNKLETLKATFQQQVQKELPNLTINVHGADIPAARAIAMLQPWQLATVIQNYDKLGADIENITQQTSNLEEEHENIKATREKINSEKDLNKALLRKYDFENSGQTNLGRAIDDMDKNGVSVVGVYNAIKGLADDVSDVIPKIKVTNVANYK